MKHHPRAKRAGVRRAIAGSVAVHLLIAVAITGVSVFRTKKPLVSEFAGKLDTCVDHKAVQLFAEDLQIPVPISEPSAEPSTEPITEPMESQPVAVTDPRSALALQPAASLTDAARTPHLHHVPNPLSAALRDRIRHSRPHSIDANVQPVNAAAAVPLHGAMMEGHSVVYVLDCSGSMGAFGKLEAARSALIATLRRQPQGVRFQVITYNSVARAVLPGGCVEATPTNIAAIEAGLANLTPSGKSNHIGAIQAAQALRPGVIVVLTDTDSLSTDRSKLLTGPPVCVAQVTADGIGPPRQLR